MRPYVDASKTENKKDYEFSLHGLSWDHVIVIYQAMKQFNKLANEDLDTLISKLESLTECEMELLVDAAGFQKASAELVKILSELE